MSLPIDASHPRWPEVQRFFELLDGGMTLTNAAAEVGVARTTASTWAINRRDGQLDVNASAKARLAAVGYDMDAPDPTPEDAWNAGKAVFERTASDMLRKQWREIKRPRGAFCIFHITDPHLDADGTPLALIEADIAAARGMGAIMAHGGDALNNWPEAGRLAKQWARQECSQPAALLRLQHYIALLGPDVWVDGNHEEFSPYLTDLIREWLPKATMTDYWNVNFIVRAKGGRPLRVVMSHKLGKGSSWFHSLHGHIRQTLEGEDADLYLDGHLHTAGAMDYHLPERGHAATLVASAGYKMVDKFARRISKSSGQLKVSGRCHFVVCDPEADGDESFTTAFRSARQAEGYLNGLANLRAV